jgi:sugar lactone lactonase YvrE
MRRRSPTLILPLILCNSFAQTYTIRTIAGSGSPENVQATATGIGTLEGIAIDSNGNVFVSSFEHNSILRLDAKTGTASTIVGIGGLRVFSSYGVAPVTSFLLIHSMEPSARYRTTGSRPLDNTREQPTRTQVLMAQSEA